jgi:hypothetical protein
VFLLPAVDLLEHGLPHEVSDPVEVVVVVDDPYKVLVVPPLDPPSDGHLREDLLLGLGQGGRRHGRYMKRGRHLYIVRIRTIRNERCESMRMKGFGEAAPRAGPSSVSRIRPTSPRGIVRLRPETWSLLASLRRPLVDSEGNLVGYESFDRVVRRILDERRTLDISRRKSPERAL